MTILLYGVYKQYIVTYYYNHPFFLIYIFFYFFVFFMHIELRLWLQFWRQVLQGVWPIDISLIRQYSNSLSARDRLIIEFIHALSLSVLELVQITYGNIDLATGLLEINHGPNPRQVIIPKETLPLLVLYITQNENLVNSNTLLFGKSFSLSDVWNVTRQLSNLISSP